MEQAEQRAWEGIRALYTELSNARSRRLKETLAKEIIASATRILLYITGTDERHEEYKQIRRNIAEYLERNYIIMQQATMERVRGVYGNNIRTEFANKKGGTQIGTVCIIHLPDERRIKWYVKTHQFGPTESTSISRYPPDAKELVAYKILEKIGCGPPCYVFWPDNVSKRSLYIATVGLNLRHFDAWEPQKEPKDTIEELLKIDFVARLLCLTDATTNTGNFGVCHDDGKGYIIDFRIVEGVTYSEKKVCESFLEKNGRYKYTGVMKMAHESPAGLKRGVIKKLIKNGAIARAIRESKQEVQTIIKTAEGSITINSSEILGKYTDDVSETLSSIVRGF